MKANATALHQAAKAGDAEEVLKIIEGDPDK
jgi:hypothetical protein